MCTVSVRVNTIDWLGTMVSLKRLSDRSLRCLPHQSPVGCAASEPLVGGESAGQWCPIGDGGDGDTEQKPTRYEEVACCDGASDGMGCGYEVTVYCSREAGAQ